MKNIILSKIIRNKSIKNFNKNKNNRFDKSNKIDFYKEKSIEKIKEYFQLNSNYHFYLLNSCDASLFYALNTITSKRKIHQINIPKEASWLSYEPLINIINTNGMKIRKYEFKNYEPIYPQLIDNETTLNIIQLNSGYLKQINLESTPHNSIIDASGFKNKINLSKFDCIMISFQHWKPINLGYGGFLAIRKELDIQKKEKTYLKKILDIQRKPLEKSKISTLQQNFTLKTYKKLYKQITSLEKRLNKFQIFFDNTLISIMNFLNKKKIKYKIVFNNNSLNSLLVTQLDKNKKMQLINELKLKFKKIDFKNDINIRFKGISIELKRFFK